MVFNIVLIYIVSIFNISPEDNGKKFIESLLKSKDYEKAQTYLDSSIRKQVSVGKLQEISEQIAVAFGDYQGIAEVRKKGKIVYYDCKFANTDYTIQVSYSDEGLINGFYFVPTPPKKDEKGVELSINSSETNLNGTFTEGKGEKTDHLLIFVHGSGPMDRDGTAMKQKPYLQMSNALVDMGVSTFRYDKRVFTPKDYTENSITIERESVIDVVNIIDFFSSQDDYKDYKLSLIGHSLGGYLAPKIANSTDKLYKVIMLAPNARPLDQILLSQMEYLYKLDPSEENKLRLEEEKEKIRYLKTADLSGDVDQEDLPLNLPASYWKSIREYNHLEQARQVNIPVLVVQGKRDYQVTMEDFSLWESAFKRNEKAVFKVCKDSNHLFQVGKGMSTPEEYRREGKLDMDMIDSIYSFLEGNYSD